MVINLKNLFFGAEAFFVFLSILMIVAGQTEAVWGIAVFLIASVLVSFSICQLIGGLIAETIVCARYEDMPLVIFATGVLSLVLCFVGAIFQSVLSVWLMVPSIVLVLIAVLAVIAVIVYEIVK